MIATAETCPCCHDLLDVGNAIEGLCAACLLERGLQAASTLPIESRASGSADLPDPLELEAALPDYDILELAGRGGMGAVYKARQRGLDRIVAVKVLPGRFALRPEMIERFEREARTLARLHHPQIVMAFDYGVTESFSFCTMEFVAGPNLRQLMAARTIDAALALRIVRDVCRGLEYAHEQGVIHRDIKPENILIDAAGNVRISDFGLAKLLEDESAELNWTHTGKVVGTMHYMSPEQCQQPHRIDQRADIYAAGVVLYELLTGKLPIGRFAAPSELAPVETNVDEVVLRALEQDPERRPQTAGEFAETIERVLAGKPTGTAKLRRANLAIPLLASAAVLALVALAALALQPEERTPDNPAKPPRAAAAPPALDSKPVVGTPVRSDDQPREALPVVLSEPKQRRPADEVDEGRTLEPERASDWQLEVNYRLAGAAADPEAKWFLVLEGGHIGRKEFTLAAIANKQGTLAAENLHIASGERLELYLELEPRPDAKRLRASNVVKYTWARRAVPQGEIRYSQKLLRPFTAIHWLQDRPHVELGDRWYALLEVNGVSMDELLAQARKTKERDYERAIEQDLPGLLEALGHELPEPFSIKLRSWETERVYEVTIATRDGKAVVSKTRERK